MIRTVVALATAGWQVAMTYRVALLSSLFSLALTIVPMYFAANALQPTMEKVIQAESTSFFAFSFVGVMVLTVIPSFVLSLPTALNAAIATGTLEVMLTTPARLPAVLLGLIGYELSWALARSAVMTIGGIALGVHISWQGFVPGLIVFALILLSYASIGLGAAAMAVAFRSTGPLPSLVMSGSALLGGVYFPTTVIPGWIESLSVVIPMTYGLRALRKLWLTDAAPIMVLNDVVSLCLLTLFFASVSVTAFAIVMRDARRRGTLGAY